MGCPNAKTGMPANCPVVPWNKGVFIGPKPPPVVVARRISVFPGRFDDGGHISTRHYARLVGDWVEGIGLGRSAYGAHSLRRTKVALIYKRMGIPRGVQILLGHTKLESSVRYLG